MAAASSTVSLKLLVDKKTRKVVFAEADKAFVDFLFHLMSLPLGTVIKLVNHNSMAGSLGNLYGSIQSISDTYLQPNVDKDVLLNPKVAVHSTAVPLLMAPGAASETKKFYVCSGCNAHGNRLRYISEYPECVCPTCKSRISTVAHYVAPLKADVTKDENGGFVKGVVTYVVMDDLKVMAHSSIATITVLNKNNIKDFSSLTVKEVHLGFDEGLKVLKAALHTDSVLTTVFLPKTVMVAMEECGMTFKSSITKFPRDPDMELWFTSLITVPSGNDMRWNKKSTKDLSVSAKTTFRVFLSTRSFKLTVDELAPAIIQRLEVCVANAFNAAVEISEGADHGVVVHEFDNGPERQAHEVEQEIDEGLVGFGENNFSCLFVDEELQTHHG
nr:DUF674 domain-containing protein [Ipomoea batatas]